MNRNVTVRIDRLVLYGIRPADRRTVAEAVVAELTDRLRKGPAFVPSSLAVVRLAPRPATIPRALLPRRLGGRIGASIHAALQVSP